MRRNGFDIIMYYFCLGATLLNRMTFNPQYRCIGLSHEKLLIYYFSQMRPSSIDGRALILKQIDGLHIAHAKWNFFC